MMSVTSPSSASAIPLIAHPEWKDANLKAAIAQAARGKLTAHHEIRKGQHAGK
jgi:predicted transcriptional regulator